ncbi:MAG: DUF4384 domain-containing protein [Proteobacteria bacterium]|nr:DUF4384 domain-containing protein [Pseudomonadota bacterium]MCK4782382.1 DUF4384 domain-containing protein [Desulfobacteraceae bacterium]
MKRFLLINLALFFAISLFSHLSSQGNAIAESKGEAKVCFRWAFGAIVGSTEDRRLVAITRDTVLKTGDRLKLLLQLKNRCFVYLFYRTAEDEIYLLFPYTLQQFDTDYKTDKKYYIPKGGTWFELDRNVGLETFYLLASAKRLLKLETLYKEYSSVSDKKKKDLTSQLLSEIRKIKRKHRKLASPAERPIAIGGKIRGVVKDDQSAFPDIDPIASEVSTSNFYGKTFTIDHK